MSHYIALQSCLHPPLEAQVETTAPDIVDGFLSYIPA